MPFIPAPNIIETEFRYNIEGQKCENRVMVDALGPVTPALLESTAILAWNWWELHYGANVGSNVHLVEVLCTDLTTDTGAQFTYAPDTTTTGAKPAPLPNEVAFCISLRSGSRGRSARGRWFAVSLSGNDRSDPNTLTGAYVSDLVAAMTLLINDLNTAGTPLVIVSYRHAGVIRPGGPVYFPVTSALAVDNIVDSQRRRKPGVGS